MSKLKEFGILDSHLDKTFDLLLWYGFFGMKLPKKDSKYIHDFNYHMDLLKGIQKKSQGKLSYTINPAYWPALMIDSH